MAPSQLSITPVGQQPIKVMFNPNSYTITKEVVWETSTKRGDGCAAADVKANAPALEFGGGRSRILVLELFFDTTESTEATRDVRVHTDQIVRLTRIVPDKGPSAGDRGPAGGKDQVQKGRPPVCIVSWGPDKREDFPFTGTVSQLTQKFVLFDQSGTPLRATLGVTFTEFLNRQDDAQVTSPEMTTRVVRRGDSLAGIAADVYGSPAMWRAVARANEIENPLALLAGTRLTLRHR